MQPVLGLAAICHNMIEWVVTEPFFIPLSTRFLEKAVYSNGICLISLSRSTATCFSSHFSSEADPSKATSNLTVGKFNDLLFGLHLGQLSARFGISASFSLVSLPLLVPRTFHSLESHSVTVPTLSCLWTLFFLWTLFTTFFKAPILVDFSPLTLFQDFSI